MKLNDPTKAPVLDDSSTHFIDLREQVIRRLEALAEALQARSEGLELSLIPGVKRGILDL